MLFNKMKSNIIFCKTTYKVEHSSQELRDRYIHLKLLNSKYTFRNSKSLLNIGQVANDKEL